MNGFRLHRWPEAVQTAVLLAVVVPVPLVVAGILNATMVYRSEVDDAEVLLGLELQHLVTQLDDFNREQLRVLGTMTATPPVVDYCRGDRDAQASLRASATRALAAFTDAAGGASVASVFSPAGEVLASTLPAAAGIDVSFRSYLRAGREGPSVSNPFVALPVADNALMIGYTAPIHDDAGGLACVVGLFVTATELDAQLRAAEDFGGEGSLALLLDDHGIRVAPSHLTGLSMRPTGVLPATEVAAMVRQRRFGDATESLLQDVVPDAELFARARADGPESGSFWGYAPSAGETALTLTQPLSTARWTAVTRIPASVVRAAPRAVASRQLALGGATLLGALALGWLVARGRVQRLQGIATAVAEVESGSGRAHVHDDGHDEIAQLVERFNRMAAAVATQRATLEQAVQARTTELTEANRTLGAQRDELRAQWEELASQAAELQRKNGELERANRLKSEFLSNMSHELRTPLNAVIGFADLLVEDPVERLGERQRGFAAAIASAGRHQLTLINDILDLAKIEAGHLRLSITAMDAAAAVQRAVQSVSVLAERAGVTLLIQSEAKAPVAVDPSRLHQLLLNLVDNAIKFGPAGSTVEIAAHDATGAVIFEVRDRGPGIPDSLRPHLFQPFQQGDASAAKQHQGTGLGLAICARLAKLHGGSLEALDRDGGGLVMRLRLPAAAEATEPRSTATRTVERPGSGERRVLVIDDDPRVAHVLSELLARRGMALTIATTGHEGLARAAARPPDLAIVDMRLPDTTGREVVAKLRADHPDLPILVLTAEDLAPHDVDAVKALGAQLARKGDVSGAELVAGIEVAVGVATAPAADGPVVLVVDDNAMNRALLRGILEPRGYTVREAETGDAALLVATSEAVNIVLMDLAMPGTSGFEATRALKANALTAHLPVVAVTALAMRSDEAAALAAGADAYFSKPIDAGALVRAVSDLLSRSKP